MYLITYDISSNRLRNKVAKKLLDYGKRVQYSVFECDIDKKRYTKLYGELSGLVASAENANVRIYHLDHDENERTVTIGDPGYVSVDSQWDDLIIV